MISLYRSAAQTNVMKQTILPFTLFGLALMTILPVTAEEKKAQSSHSLSMKLRKP